MRFAFFCVVFFVCVWWTHLTAQKELWTRRIRGIQGIRSTNMFDVYRLGVTDMSRSTLRSSPVLDSIVGTQHNAWNTTVQHLFYLRFQQTSKSESSCAITAARCMYVCINSIYMNNACMCICIYAHK